MGPRAGHHSLHVRGRAADRQVDTRVLLGLGFLVQRLGDVRHGRLDADVSQQRIMLTGFVQGGGARPALRCAGDGDLRDALPAEYRGDGTGLYNLAQYRLQRRHLAGGLPADPQRAGEPCRDRELRDAVQPDLRETPAIQARRDRPRWRGGRRSTRSIPSRRRSSPMSTTSKLSTVLLHCLAALPFLALLRRASERPAPTITRDE